MSKPNFLIIGERRSGTTTLARWIEAHSEIYLHPKMDTAYFIDKELVGAMEWKIGKANYGKWDQEHSIEEYCNKFSKVKDQIAIGEKSADYLYWHQSHKRIKEYFPDIKLIITLRNPIDRAWSMYWNELGKGRETLSFEDALNEEDKRILESDYARNHLSYKTRGFYDESIMKLLETFPKEQIKVFILEHVKKDPKRYMQELYSFLGVNSSIGFDNIQKKYNANWTAIPKPFFRNNPFLGTIESAYFRVIKKIASKILFPKNIYNRRKFHMIMAKPFRFSKSDFKISKEVRESLENIYRPHNKNLEKVLEIDLSVWLEE